MGAIQLLFPFLAEIYFQKIVTLVPLIGLISDKYLIDNLRNPLSSRQGKALIFLVLWMIMSVPLSIYPGWSFAFLTQNFWKILVMVLLVLAYGSSKESLNKIIWAYILASGLLSILTVMASGASRTSITGGAYDPNDTALQFLLALPFVVWKYRSSKGFSKVLTAFISLILIIGIVDTQSRGGFLGLLAVAALISLQIKRIEKGGLPKVLVPLLAIGVIIYYFGGTTYLDRVSTILHPSNDYNVTSQTGRIDIWKRGIDMMLNNPLLGVGVAGFVSADGRLYAGAGARWNAAHNSFVQIGAELGFPGLIAFCFLIWSSIKKVREILVANREANLDNFKIITSYSIIGSWAGFIVSGFFLSAAYTSYLFFLIALSMAFISLEKPNEQQVNSLTYGNKQGMSNIWQY